jgi:hypothetical protein
MLCKPEALYVILITHYDRYGFLDNENHTRKEEKLILTILQAYNGQAI